MKFNNKNFTNHNGWLHYEGQFVARFRGAGIGSFKKFLRENFTVKEYFDMYNSGMAPLKILETKGYMSDNIKKSLESMGYTPDAEGKAKWLKDKKGKYGRLLGELYINDENINQTMITEGYAITY